jgi:hypothetical protein
MEVFMASVNAPVLKKDVMGNVIQNNYGEYSFRGQYTGTNIIYEGKARPGAVETNPVWQIRKMSYDGSNNVLTILWPQDSSGSASSEYEFQWSARAGYTYA